jgi:hypothetical protein
LPPVSAQDPADWFVCKFAYGQNCCFLFLGLGVCRSLVLVGMTQSAHHGFYLPQISINYDAHEGKVQVHKFVGKVKIDKGQDPADVKLHHQ